MEGGTERRRSSRRSALPRGDHDDAPVSEKKRRDPVRRDSGRDNDHHDSQPDQEQKPRSEQGLQEGDSLAALKVILAKVAPLLKPLQLSPEESIGLVERLYGRVLELDLRLAGEADDTRKSSVLAHIQETVIRRDGDTLLVDFPEG